MSDDKTSLGLAPNVAAALSYVLGVVGFGFVSGIIVFILERENRFVRFHSMQSIFLSVTFLTLSIIASFIPVIHEISVKAVYLGNFICWLLAIIKAAQGQFFKFPIIGDLADQRI
ncbi:MAG: DUF4870 domain-containing protein [Eubacteriales bacterium]|nr:MAG: hypothetical protein CVV03_07020 [Firmicutes bacterium HGW-Firmicutes-8]